jgi:hypothetical protein
MLAAAHLGENVVLGPYFRLYSLAQNRIHDHLPQAGIVTAGQVLGD